MRNALIAISLLLASCSSPLEPPLASYEAWPVVVEGTAVLSARVRANEWARGESEAMLSLRLTNPGNEPATVSFGHCAFGISVREGVEQVFQAAPPPPLECPWGQVTIEVLPGAIIDRDLWGISREIVRPEGGDPRTYWFAAHLLRSGESRVRRIEAGDVTY